MTYAISSTQTLSQWYKDTMDDPSNTVIYELHKPNPNAGIAMHAAGGDEMIKITNEGFFVRGVKVPADEHEAETVYNAFKQWLAWANLQQQR